VMHLLHSILMMKMTGSIDTYAQLHANLLAPWSAADEDGTSTRHFDFPKVDQMESFLKIMTSTKQFFGIWMSLQHRNLLPEILHWKDANETTCNMLHTMAANIDDLFAPNSDYCIVTKEIDRDDHIRKASHQ